MRLNDAPLVRLGAFDPNQTFGILYVQGAYHITLLKKYAWQKPCWTARNRNHPEPDSSAPVIPPQFSGVQK